MAGNAFFLHNSSVIYLRLVASKIVKGKLCFIKNCKKQKTEEALFVYV